MSYIVKLQLSQHAEQDEERRTAIEENLREGTIQLKVFPKPRMEIRLSNGTHIEVNKVLVLQKEEALAPDCIIHVA